MRSRVVLLAVSAIAFLAGSGTSASASSPSRLNLPPSSAVPLQVIQVATPPLPVPEYRYSTSGTYPQVTGATFIDAANRGLTNAMVAYQRRYVAKIYRTYGHHYKGFLLGPSRGLFSTYSKYSIPSQLEHISASTGVVSALIPVEQLYPGGNDGSVWSGLTVRVADGSRVFLRDLFSRSKKALPAITRLARTKLAHTNNSVHASLNDKIDRQFMVHSFAPRPRHGAQWALTPTGFAIGYPQGLVSCVPCSRIDTTIPYWRLDRYLSDSGRQLIADVRWPHEP
jgi:hypothetical protein